MIFLYYLAYFHNYHQNGKYKNIWFFASEFVPLQHDALHSFATSPAMAQERIRVCADFLQQQPVEVGIVLAYVDSVCLILPHLEFDLLF